MNPSTQVANPVINLRWNGSREVATATREDAEAVKNRHAHSQSLFRSLMFFAHTNSTAQRQ